MVGLWKEGYWLVATVGVSAYFDESGVDRSHRIAVVAGFVATTDMWTEFERQWSKQMAHKPPKLKWKKYVQQECVSFSKIARKFSLKAIDCPCTHGIFQAFSEAEPSPINNENASSGLRITSIYEYCSLICCEILDNWANERKLKRVDTPIKVIFDKGSEHQAMLDRGYETYYKRKTNTYLRGAAIFERDDVLLPLQAAHLFAWLLSKHHNNRTPERKALDIIMRDGHASHPFSPKQ